MQMICYTVITESEVTNMNYTEVINNAINEYEEAKRSGKGVEQAINDMENVYIMVADKNVKGSENLRKMILEAKENV